MDYYSEIKKLAPEIQDILSSSFGTAINTEIIAKYQLDSNQAGLFIDFINDLYLKVLKIDNLENRIISALKLNSDSAHSLTLDIAGLKLLVADDYFKGEILNFLSKNNGDLTGYGKRVMEEKAALEKEKAAYLEDEKPLGPIVNKVVDNKVANKSKDNFLNLDDDSVSNFKEEEEEKKAAVLLFKEDLIDVLEVPDDFKNVIADYNETLIDLLHDEEFKKNLENALYSNQEKIGENRISINDHEADETVANWLKDFIKINGSELFSGVVLAQYLSGAANTKKLNPAEKHLLSQLLKLYRNLAFFPDSMENLPLENWQIIPFEVRNSGKEVPRAASGNISTATKSLKKTISQPDNISDKPNITAELQELQTQLLVYPENSFEYKALKQEIVRFRKKTKI